MKKIILLVIFLILNSLSIAAEIDHIIDTTGFAAFGLAHVNKKMPHAQKEILMNYLNNKCVMLTLLNSMNKDTLGDKKIVKIVSDFYEKILKDFYKELSNELKELIKCIELLMTIDPLRRLQILECYTEFINDYF